MFSFMICIYFYLYNFEQDKLYERLNIRKEKMKTVSRLIPLIGLCFIVTGCTSDYVISTNDGHLITTHGKPEKDKDTGLIKYRDKNGNRYEINNNQIKEIVEK